MRRQTRRSISVAARTYLRLKMLSEHRGSSSFSSTVTELIDEACDRAFIPRIPEAEAQKKLYEPASRATVERWNKNHAIGTEVLYNGSMQGWTTSEAFMDGHYPVVRIAPGSGVVDVRKLTPVQQVIQRDTVPPELRERTKPVIGGGVHEF